MAVLKKMTGESAGQLIDLKAETIVIGRDPTLSHIILGSNAVSRKHAEIRRSSDGYSLVDLNSRNKTKLNGNFVNPETPIVLASNDLINICDFEFIFFPYR